MIWWAAVKAGGKVVHNRRSKQDHRKGNKGRSEAPGTRIVIGRNAVGTVLCEPSRVIKLLVASDERGRAGALLKIAQQSDVEVEFCSKQALSQRTLSDSHQGFAAIVKARPLGSRQELLNVFSDRENFLLLALDGVTDPHNVGAILRAAECFAVDGVVWSKNRSSGITPAVTKVAVGATELVPLYEVSNLADTLFALEDQSEAVIACADGGPDSLALSEFSRPDKCILVLGSEGGGVSDLIMRRAGAKIRIPMHGHIDSLNVSQAAAVMLHMLVQ